MTAGKTATITRTLIKLNGTHATNGSTDTLKATSPTDDKTLQSATSITCGDLTLTHDGLSATE